MTNTGSNGIAASGTNNRTISDAYLEIGKLVFECWKIFQSFRLLAAILRTDRYSTVYESMTRSTAFVGCKRSRPSRDEQEAIAGIPSEIMAAMSDRNITVRRWCHAHGLDLVDLWYRRNPDGSDADVVTFLKEDFPEIFGLNPTEYITAPIGYDRQHMFNKRKKCHVYWSNFFHIRVQHSKENEAIRLFNWRLHQVIIKKRLQLLLSNGVDAALSYPHTEFISVPGDKNINGERRIPVDLEEMAMQQKLHDMLRRDSEANALIRKLAKFSTVYRTDAEHAQECLIHDQLINTYGWTMEQIRNETGRIRRKMASSK